jgi:uncharacterized membrane protein
MADGDRSSSNGKGDLGEEVQHLLSALAGRVLSEATERVGGLTDKLAGSVGGDGGDVKTKALGKAGEKMAEGKSPVVAGLAAGAEGLKEKVKGVFGGGGGGGGKSKKLKLTNIVETIDVGAPVRVVYNQWTQFEDFPSFMKKVESVDQADEQKLNWKAQIWWSHRSWEATIVDQVPDERIVWRSKGQKGHVDGAVTFHETGPNLTRVLIVMEYYPQGLFEQTGNLWRAQGRRTRLELKHFRRHVMTQALLHPEELEGWRGEIHDSKVVKSHEEAMEEEDQQNQQDENQQDEDQQDEDYDTEDAEDEYAEDEGDEDEGDEDEGDEDEGDEDAEDEYDAEEEGEDADDEYAEDEYDAQEEEGDDESEERPRPRKRARAGRR